MKRWTASNSAQLAGGCNAFLADDARWVDLPRAGTVAGIEKHAVMQGAVDGSDAGEVGDRALDAADAFAPLLEEVVALGEALAEVSFAWDPATGSARVLGIGEGRSAYARALPGEAGGTCDLLVIIATPTSRRGILCDYKQHAPGATPPDAREQLRSLAMFASRACDLEAVEIRTGLLGEREGRWADAEELGADELDAIAVERSEQLTRPIGPPVPGSWCRWCPHRADCSVAIDAVDALVDTLPASALVRTNRLEIDIRDDAHLEWTLAMFAPIEERLAAIKAAAKRYADDRQALGMPVVFADGRVYTNEPYEVETPALTRPGCVDVIREYGAGAAIRPATTWEAIEKTIGPQRTEALRATLRDSDLLYSRMQDKYAARQTPEQKAAKKARKARAA